VPYLDVPPVPPNAAGVLLLAAPAGPATARLDGHAMTIPGGGTLAVPLPAGYPGGTLSLAGAPAAATELLGKPADPAPDDALDTPQLGAVSSVLSLTPADPAAPTFLVADPAVAR
jgi:hypothetical protein